MPDWLTSILLGVIEGITEFLPISSTGHLLVPQQLGWLEKQTDLFNIAIQSGAVIAVLFNFTDRVKQLTFRWREPEARDYLAKAVKLNPEDSRAQHFLGSALNNLGQRKAAETALRKAVQIKPGYSEAHHNLAVVYATQNPPFIALAKFHYDKAIDGGHKKNADLEKILNRGN